MKKNCWEFMGCGRGPEKGLGACPAAMDKRLDGVHGGKNAGRTCWVLAGTYCGGEVQGTFAQKHKDCSQCEFYKLVRKEEGPTYQILSILLNKLDDTAE